MKTQSKILQPLTKQQVASLTTEVNETLAKSINHETIRPISSAELWNIQRHHRTMFSRRKCL